MKSTLLILSAISLLLPSCVLGRRTIDPEIPTANHAPAKGTVAIAGIQDLRVFQNKPSDPAAPSVDGDHASMGPAEKSRMAGRQRNGFGKAMGDIALSSNIQTKVRDLLAEAFARRGYTLASTSGNRASADVQRFWAWATPGMWSLGFEAIIQCRVTVSKGGTSRTFNLTGKGSNGGQVASNTNWNQAYERAFEDLLGQLDSELQLAGF